MMNRQARTRFGSTESRIGNLKQGLPHYAVLSLTLFLIFINYSFGEVSRGCIVSRYANDLAIAVHDENKENAERRMQLEVR